MIQFKHKFWILLFFLFSCGNSNEKFDEVPDGKIISPLIEKFAKKGHKYLQILENTIKYPEENSLETFLKLSKDINYITENFILEKGTFKEVANKIDPTIVTGFYPKDWDLESDHLISVGFILKRDTTSLKDKSKKNYYIFRINLKKGIIICDHMFRGDNSEAPATSSFIHYAYKLAFKSLPFKKLNKIISFNIHNDETMSVINEIKRLYKLGSEYRLKVPAYSSFGKALLATPNLRLAIWLSNDFDDILQSSRPKSITLFSEQILRLGGQIDILEVSFK